MSASGVGQARNRASDVSIEQVGVVGLGIMGRPMAANLLKAGFRVTVWNRGPGTVAELTSKGAEAGGSPAGVAGRSQVVITMLPDTPDVESVLFGPNGVAHGITPGGVVIDMSTISPAATEGFAARLEERGAEMLDAPVSGGEQHSRSTTDPEDLEEERRLAYVAMTRAERYLYVTHAMKRRVYGEEIVAEPSQFLNEMPQELLEDLSLGKSWCISGVKLMLLRSSRPTSRAGRRRNTLVRLTIASTRSKRSSDSEIKRWATGQIPNPSRHPLPRHRRGKSCRVRM